MGSLYCSWLSSTWQSTTSCSTICQKRLQADHVSFRTYLSVRTAVTRRTQEKCSHLSLFYKGLHGPREWTPMSYQLHLILWKTFTVMSSCIDSYKFSFLSRTATYWNALSAYTRAKQSTDAFIRVGIVECYWVEQRGYCLCLFSFYVYMYTCMYMYMFVLFFLI